MNLDTIEIRHDMAQQIVDFEARRDANGLLEVYNLPVNDGGGHFEVAGINEKYDPVMCAQLVSMIKFNKQKEAESLAVQYIRQQTDIVIPWSSNLAIEFVLRDTMFNRGLTGCAKILQHAVGTKDDGIVGPLTRQAIANAQSDIKTFLGAIRDAREWYEITHIGQRDNLEQGLINRWNNANTYALTILQRIGYV